MWKKLLNSEYFLCLTNNLEVYVTDYISIWSTRYTDTSFLTCLKDSNFGLEMDDTVLVDKGMKMLTHPEGLKTVRAEKEEEKCLTVFLSMSFGFPLKLRMKLTEGTRELFFQKVTQQLLRTIQDLHSSEHELRRLLQKKDEEIEEYKCEGGEIALRHLKTIPFDDKAHMVKYTTYSEHFGSTDIHESLLNKTIAVPDEVTIKQEETTTNGELPNVKTEPHAEVKSEEIKCEQQSVKSEEIKCEEQSVKTESPSDSRSYRPMVSPHKRQRRKLNL